MPSPFPGMDPYLEDPDLWPDVHASFIGVMRTILNRGLRPHYVARIERRIYKEFGGNPLQIEARIPDIRIERLTGPASSRAEAAVRPKVHSAVRLRTMADSDPIREGRIKILDVRTKNVVTIIKVLSPSNKKLGSNGRNSYLRKRQEVAKSDVHFVEIDLLRAGVSTFPRPVGSDYAVHVSRFEDRPTGWVWGFGIRGFLPTISVPLMGKDAEYELDLQDAWRTTYEDGAYEDSMEYGAPATPPLSGKEAAWARQMIAAWRKAKKRG